MLSLRAAALSDIGRVRHENEDRFLLDESNRIFGIADGVGGLPGGGEAAQLAADEIIAGLKDRSADQEPDLVKLMRHTNRAVANLGVTISRSMGIGTTLTFGCIHGDLMLIGHVGDSRCYLLRQSKLIQVTDDHSVENDARLARARGETVHYHDLNRNALTRCIGQPSPLEVDVIRQPLHAGDRYLFCTDGVTRLIPDPELETLLGKADSPKAVSYTHLTLPTNREV